MEAVPLQLPTQADIGKLPEWVNDRTFHTGMMRWSGSPETSYKLSLIGLAYATASRRPPKWQKQWHKRIHWLEAALTQRI